jgi:hypothetical protein
LANHCDVLQYAAKLASINKGNSLNSRDANTRLRFFRKHCEIVSGGLFAVCSLQIPLDKENEATFDIEMSNAMLQTVASELREEPSLEISVDGVMAHFQFSKGYFDIPIRTEWTRFDFEYYKDTFCEVGHAEAHAITSSVPKLLQSSDEKHTMAAMRISADAGLMRAFSTDMKIAARLTVPCKGTLSPINLPFAGIAVVRWAVSEFGEMDSLKIAQSGGQIVVKCGPFFAWLKQIDIQFPDINKVFLRSEEKSTSAARFDTRSVASAASQASKMGYDACRLYLESDTRMEAGESANDRFKVAVSGTFSDEARYKISPDYVVTATNCLSRLAFPEFDFKYNAANAGLPVLIRASREDGCDISVVIAALEWDRGGVAV